MAADFLWAVFMLAGIEHVRFGPGTGAANYLVVENIAFSHSLMMDAIWAALFALAFGLARHRSRLATWLLFFVVLSHWGLDVVSHRPDMTLAPGVSRYFGLGLWTSVPATLVVEGGLWGAALFSYARAARPTGRIGMYALWIGVALLTLAWFNNVAGPPPPNPRTAPIASLVFFSLTVAWPYWIDALR